MMRILLLGGTTEASSLATSLEVAGIETVFSYAGRTNAPILQPMPTRVGGFGGVEGLRTYLTQNAITHVVDATHPFAAQMSRNAHAACAADNIPLMRMERPAWTPQAGDRWTQVDSIDAVPNALPDKHSRIFLAIGRQHLALFLMRPQHHYLLRLIDAPRAPIALPHHTVTLARGPFTVEGDIALMTEHRITHVVAKNAGGSAASAKLEAARGLGLPVIMVRRPTLPDTAVCADVETVLLWLGHKADRGV